MTLVPRQAIVRIIPTREKKLFLTFDDGPDAESTPAILDALAECKVPATFFLVAKKAQAQAQLLARIKREGHAIGNHSLDHGYTPFFCGRSKIKNWVNESEDLLSNMIGAPTVGFRPPAGVYTPELCSALRDLKMPLVLWHIRFFDAVIPWNTRMAFFSMRRTRPGSIALLHDAQRTHRLDDFLTTLRAYVGKIRESFYTFESLNRELCLRAANSKNTR